MRSIRSAAAVAVVAVVATVSLAACADLSTTNTTPTLAALVLNTFGASGVTAVDVASGASSHVDFGAAFDGATFTILGDSLLSTSSSFGGDQLYLADWRAGSVSRAQLPPGSNPAGAAFVPIGIPGAGNGRYIAALRNARALAQVKLNGATAVVTTIAATGECPTDVAFYNGSAWSVDANQACSTDYTVFGGGRLIRVPLDGGARDTIALTNHVLAPQRAIVIDQFAYVFASGDFFSTGAALAKVNLATKQLLQIISLSADIYGVTMTLGKDGLLYLTAAPNPPLGGVYSPHVYVVDPATMTTRGPYASANNDHTLLKSDGTQARCSAATADASGRIYCVENGSATSALLIFQSNGTFVSTAPSGTIASDIRIP